jgi:hypothetical protein
MRQKGLPGEPDMCIMESTVGLGEGDIGFLKKYLPGRVFVDDAAGKGESPHYMRGRFRSRSGVWKGLGASAMVMDWVENGFMARFHSECPALSKRNQESCYDPPEHRNFIDESITKLLDRGVVGRWDPARGRPRVVSPLKVVPKKGGLFRLILDLSRLNKYLVFPRFKYDNIDKVAGVFEKDDYVFAWDLKDGYWHQELHQGMHEYMCFEWNGELLYFACMPFGLAPACWVFTKLIRVAVDYWRSRGMSCLSYIDDGIGGSRGFRKTLSYRDMVIETLVDSGWFINWVKSHWELSKQADFIGYRISTEGLGYKEPSASRVDKLAKGVDWLLKDRTVSARRVAQVAGYIVSLRPVFDPMALLFTKHMYIWISQVSESCGWDRRQVLDGQAREEVRVWKTWLPRWLRKPLWSDGVPPVWVQAQDASDKAVGGWLGHLGGMDLQTDFKGRSHIVGFPSTVLEAVGRLDAWDQEQSSTYRELYALYFMIDSFKEVVRGSSILIQADNKGVFYICSTGRSSVLVIHSLLVKLFWMCLDYGIAWDIVWLPRELNQRADDLSKFVDVDDWRIGDRVWDRVQSYFGPFTCDRFAANGNNLLDCFCALHWCPGVWFVDCFSGSWEQGFSWWNPNPKEVPRILLKVRKDRAQGALLLPVWAGAWWWTKLCPDGRHFGGLVRGWIELERSRDLFVKGASGCFWSKERPRTPVIVVWLDGTVDSGQDAGRLGFCAIGGCDDCRLDDCFI